MASLYDLGSGLGSLARGIPYALGKAAALPKRYLIDYPYEAGAALPPLIGEGVADLSAGFKGIPEEPAGIEAAPPKPAPTNIAQAAGDLSFARNLRPATGDARAEGRFIEPSEDPLGLGALEASPSDRLPQNIEEAAVKPRAALRYSTDGGPLQDYDPSQSRGGFVTGSNPESELADQEERLRAQEGSAIEALLAKIQGDPFYGARQRAGIDTQRQLDVEYGKGQIGLAEEVARLDKIRAFEADEDRKAQAELRALAGRRDYQGADPATRKQMEDTVRSRHEMEKQAFRQQFGLATGKVNTLFKQGGDLIPGMNP